MSRRAFSLLELVVVLCILTILTVIILPSFKAQLNRAAVEESAQRLQEAVKSAQREAQKRTFVAISSPSRTAFAKQAVYLALHPATGRIRIAVWQDSNLDARISNNELTLIQEIYLTPGTSFSLPASITKVACSNTGNRPAGSIVNFNSSGGPIGTELFPIGTYYLTYDEGGYIDGLRYNAVYISGNGGDSYAVAVNPLGLTGLCRWNKGKWVKVR